MTERSVRPSGITALAVLNFIFGGFQSLNVLISLLSMGCTVTVNGVAQPRAPGTSFLFTAIDLAGAAALFIAGAAFMRVDRRGRWAANAYVLCAAAGVALRLILPMWGGGPPGFFSVMSLIYPLLVAVYANVVFRDLWRLPGVPGRAKKAGAAPKRKPIPHVILIAQASIRQALRGASGVLFILAAWGVGLLTAQILFWAASLFQMRAPQGVEPSLGLVLERINAFILPLINQLLSLAPGSAVEGWAEYLLFDRPGFLSLLFLIYGFVTPAIVSFIGSSQISSDTRFKGLRFLLLRTTRRDIYFGKLLGSSLVAALVLLVLVIATLAHVQLRVGVYELAPVMLWGLWGILAFAVISFPYVSLSLGFSGVINSGVGAFFSSIGALIGVPVLAFSLSKLWQPLGYISYLLPYRAALLMFHKSPAIVALAVLVLAGYGTAYAMAGYFIFRRRDL
jgi:hypothetical protein